MVSPLATILIYFEGMPQFCILHFEFCISGICPNNPVENFYVWMGSLICQVRPLG